MTYHGGMAETILHDHPERREVPLLDNQVEPRILPLRGGGFLAVSALGQRPRIGVRGDSEAEARAAFRRSYLRWSDLIAAATERVAASVRSAP